MSDIQNISFIRISFIERKFNFDNRRKFAQKLKKLCGLSGFLLGGIIYYICWPLLQLDGHFIWYYVIVPLILVNVSLFLLKSTITAAYIKSVQRRIHPESKSDFEAHRYAISSIIESTNIFFETTWFIAGSLFQIAWLLEFIQ